MATDPPRRWASRIGWLIAIWTASVLALGVVALIIRALMTGLSGFPCVGGRLNITPPWL